VVICLERGADLHMAQLMQLPLTVSCFSKIEVGFTFLVLAHLGSPGQRAVKRYACVRACMHTRLVLLFWYWLTWVVLDKGPLNVMCVRACVHACEIGFTFLVLAHLGSPGQRAVKRYVCVRACVRACMRVYAAVLTVNGCIAAVTL